MVTGSFALVYYAAPRSTQDIDIVIAPTDQQLRKLIDLLVKSDYYADVETAREARARQSMFNVIDFQTGWKTDLIICKSRSYDQQAFQRRISVRLHGVDLYLATAEDVIISKLEWAKLGESERQIRDVVTILKVMRDSLDRAYIQNWVNQLDLGSQWQNAIRESGLGI